MPSTPVILPDQQSPDDVKMAARRLRSDISEVPALLKAPLAKTAYRKRCAPSWGSGMEDQVTRVSDYFRPCFDQSPLNHTNGNWAKTPSLGDKNFRLKVIGARAETSSEAII